MLLIICYLTLIFPFIAFLFYLFYSIFFLFATIELWYLKKLTYLAFPISYWPFSSSYLNVRYYVFMCIWKFVRMNVFIFCNSKSEASRIMKFRIIVKITKISKDTLFKALFNWYLFFFNVKLLSFIYLYKIWNNTL